MPQGKLKAKVKLPPKTKVRVVQTKTNATRKAAPMKAKNLSFGDTRFLKNEKTIKKRIESEMRNRATSDGKGASGSSIKGSDRHSAPSSGTVNKVAMKRIIRKLK